MIGVISCPIRRSLEIASPEQVEWFSDDLRPSISPRHLFLCLSHEYKRATVLTVITVGSQTGKEKKNENVFSWEVLSFYSGRELFLEDLFICLTVIESLGYLCKKMAKKIEWLSFQTPKVKWGRKVLGNECWMDLSTEPKILGKWILVGRGRIYYIMRLGLAVKNIW